MKILHISHHYGCLKDHQYICNKLGHNLENIFTHWMGNDNFPRGYFRTTKELANNIWDKNKDYFNSFDYIITSDTSPLSRIFLQNLNDFNGKLNIWVCNRFNYDVENDKEYHDLLREKSSEEKVKVIPYTEFERIWLNRYSIHTKFPTIKPIGLNIKKSLTENDKLEMGYGGKPELNFGDILISKYHNDHNFQNSKLICETQGLISSKLEYRGPEHLSEIVNSFICYLGLPDAYSKLCIFEQMQLGLPSIVPTKQYLLKLKSMPGYHFSTGLWNETVSLCEWYNEYCSQYVRYIDDMSEIKSAFEDIKNNLDSIKTIMKQCGEEHKYKTLEQWKYIYEN